MNKLKYIFLTLMLFIFNTHSISAACSEEEINNFKKVEDEYTVKYKANVDTKDYSVTLNIPLMDQYSIAYPIDFPKIKDYTETSLTFSGIKPGEYQFEVVSVNPKCENVFKTITLKLSEFNKYYEDPLCDGIEEFVLCSPTYEKKIDYDTFVSRVETYKKTKAKKEEDAKAHEEPKQEENQFTQILNYIEDNLITIMIIAVFIILVLITTIITAKSIRKSRRLE